jgi:hypothetical protein
VYKLQTLPPDRSYLVARIPFVDSLHTVFRSEYGSH